MNILVTGGAGYIGSHVIVELLEAGHDVVVVDNLCNSSRESLAGVEKITGKKVKFYEVDLRDAAALEAVFSAEKFDAVVHCAGLKAVGESAQKPLLYYDNNVGGAINLLNAMQKHGARRLVFSSSATVYGIPEAVPVGEDAPLSAINPYGRTKLMQEKMFGDICAADKEWSIINLRYFNPIGAHPSGIIGENPRGIPNNLAPYILKVAAGELGELGVFGNDYPTRDGTCVRDYIHVVDLARGHVAAIEKAAASTGCRAYNLGTGRGYSVLEIIRAFEEACGRNIPYSFKQRRAGDAAELYADASRAKAELGWSAQLTLADMCRDAWNFAKPAK
jgi:UDP-glucose 4-epimerase